LWAFDFFNTQFFFSNNKLCVNVGQIFDFVDSCQFQDFKNFFKMNNHEPMLGKYLIFLVIVGFWFFNLFKSRKIYWYWGGAILNSCATLDYTNTHQCNHAHARWMMCGLKKKIVFMSHY